MNLPPLRLGVFSAVALLLTGCATTPTDLREPSTVTCFVLKEPLVSRDKYGLLDVEWEVKLAAGPYVSERVDQDGTYFRAPPGGMYQARTGFEDKPAGLLTHQVTDGGIYLPHKKAEPVRLYKYFTLGDVPIVAQPADVDCRTAVFVKNPATGQLVANMPEVSAAASDISLRAALQPNGPGIGSAAVGGAIGGAIVTALIQNDIGKIVPGHPVKDPKFLQVLREHGEQAVPIKPIETKSPTGG